MSRYKKLAADFIQRNSIKDRDAQIGVVMFAYLHEVEFKKMAQYHCEANNYCYQLTNGAIGILPVDTINRITDEVVSHLKN